MQIAHVDGARALPVPGGKGYCPVCGTEAVAKCGQFNRWHWAHKGRRHCDPWWDNETDWHRGWKQCFDSNLQEVVRTDEHGEKHIADVLTESGVVLEFQNSPMSVQELQSRENFYKKMVWVVNAAPFKNHLVLHAQRLPPPDDALLSDVQFSAGLEHPRPCFAFFRPSEFIRDSKLQRLIPIWEIDSAIDTAYAGHHPITWKRPRSVWLEATLPIVFDTGNSLLELVSYQNHGRPFIGARPLNLHEFLASHGGGISPLMASLRPA